MGSCRFLHWLPPDDGTGKYSFTKKHCLKRYNSDIPVHINCYYTVHKASKSNSSKPPIEFTYQKVCLPGMFPLGNNFYCYLRKPLRCRGPGQLPSLPPFKSGPGPGGARGQTGSRSMAAARSFDTIRYDTRCYYNVRSKADMNRLNLPHGGDN